MLGNKKHVGGGLRRLVILRQILDAAASWRLWPLEFLLLQAIVNVGVVLFKVPRTDGSFSLQVEESVVGKPALQTATRRLL
jgi:hypothetical protein